MPYLYVITWAGQHFIRFISRFAILGLIIFLISFELHSHWRSSSGSNKFDGNYKATRVKGTGGEYSYKNPTLVMNSFESKEPNIYLTFNIVIWLCYCHFLVLTR